MLRTAFTARLRALRVLALLLLGPGLVACAGPRVSERDEGSRAGPPNLQVAAYPLAEQGDRQIRQDRYECHVWAVQESGFDPSRTRLTRAVRPVRVVPNPPAGDDTMTGLFGGAIVGAMVSDPYHSGRGAAVGAMVGAGLGLFSDLMRLFAAQRAEDAYAERAAAAQSSGNWAQAEGYRRALAACLQGRNYSVK